MQPDPTLDQIREVRHRISQQCAHDPKKLVAYTTWRVLLYVKRDIGRESQTDLPVPNTSRFVP